MASVESPQPSNNDNVNDDDKDVLKSLQSLQTGDLLLYRTTDLGATFNAVVQGSFYSHVSLIVRGDRGKLVEFYPDDYKNCSEIDNTDDDHDNFNKKDDDHSKDVTNNNTKSGNRDGEIAIFEVVPNRGVALFPMEARLARTIKFIRHLSVRRHEGSISEESQNRLYDFIKTVMGRNLEILTIDLFRALLFNRCKCSQQVIGNFRGEDWEEFFCSELVAEGLQQLGIIRDDLQVKSNLMIPSSFADPRDRTKMRHSGAFDFCDDKICLPGHNYTVSELLIKKHNKLYYSLKEKKKRMKVKVRLVAKQKLENSVKDKTKDKNGIRKKRFSSIVARKC